MSHCSTCYQHDGKHIPECPVPKKRTKYRNEPVEVDGWRFASRKEANYYCELKMARVSGDLLYFLRQVPFHLQCGARYVADFLEIWKDGDIYVTDIKGFKTKEYTLKKAMVENEYPVKIREL